MLSLAAALMLAVGPAIGQVIITEGDNNHNRGEQNAEEVSVMVPGQGLDVDQWKIAPLGNGVLLLAGLGAAYLLRRRKGNVAKNSW